MNSTAIRAFFDTRVDEWDSLRYSDETYIGRARAGIRFVCAAGTHRRVLDLGCGTGRQSVGLLKSGQAVVSADFSPEMAKATRERILRECPQSVPLVVVADATRLPFREESFDAVLALGLVGFIQDRDHLLQELGAVIDPDGELVCDAGAPEERVLLRMVSRIIERPLLRMRNLWYTLRRQPIPSMTKGWYAQNFIKHAPAEFETLLQRNGFLPFQRSGAGFGELCVLGVHLLPWRLHSGLTRYLNALSTGQSAGFLARHALTYVVRSGRAPVEQRRVDSPRNRPSRQRATALH